MSFLDDYINDQLKDPEFKKAWDESEASYQLARQLIDLRKQRGLTQKQLAKRVETQQSSISRAENGDHNLTIGTMAKITRGLGARIVVVQDNEEVIVKRRARTLFRHRNPDGAKVIRASRVKR
ncbi:MAG: helix-turn-helix transcriptional regulator [Sporolactobacillus sp.]|uniref:helix-turn-helix transcriptional regulator n=1 Tax=Sporolactobacillus sp. STSJ-5 TaxID=2965076 RepID=UPI002105861E|nr:helix-turn-helix transcriptional regulator [Sporolactobacillus sp. STSJ-5]MCQ2009184.1 helix-turn-helix domain-containing protein [Sporolactobacillus sp. STSJ-5]